MATQCYSSSVDLRCFRMMRIHRKSAVAKCTNSGFPVQTVVIVWASSGLRHCIYADSRVFC